MEGEHGVMDAYLHVGVCIGIRKIESDELREEAEDRL